MRAVLLSDGPELVAADFNELGPAGDPDGVASTAGRGDATGATAGRPSSPASDATPFLGGGSPSGSEAQPGLEERLRTSLGRQIEAAVASGHAVAAPLGKWLAEDLILEANAVAAGVARRAAGRLGIPETTFRRRLQKAARNEATGMSPRPDNWQEVRDLLAELVRSEELRGRNLPDLAEKVLLDEVVARFPGDVRISSALVGVTEPTFLRRLA